MNPKLGNSSKGKLMHFSVGALIRRDNEILLIDRVKPPYGFAGIAGHVDEGETETEALIREVKEESGLGVKKYKLLFEEELDWNQCSKGIGIHYWFLFECTTSGDLVQNEKEEKSIAWYDIDEIRRLKLEPAWEYWFRKLGYV